MGLQPIDHSTVFVLIDVRLGQVSFYVFRSDISPFFFLSFFFFYSRTDLKAYGWCVRVLVRLPPLLFLVLLGGIWRCVQALAWLLSVLL